MVHKLHINGIYSAYRKHRLLNKRKIFFPTKFLHGLYDGGHGAGLEGYRLRMWNNPLAAGGFLWGFADEAVERTDLDRTLPLQQIELCKVGNQRVLTFDFR